MFTAEYEFEVKKFNFPPKRCENLLLKMSLKISKSGNIAPFMFVNSAKFQLLSVKALGITLFSIDVC